MDIVLGPKISASYPWYLLHRQKYRRYFNRIMDCYINKKIVNTALNRIRKKYDYAVGLHLRKNLSEYNFGQLDDRAWVLPCSKTYK